MSQWLSSQSVSLAMCVATGLRAMQSMQSHAVALTRPSSLRRAQAHVVRLITVVAGH